MSTDARVSFPLWLKLALYTATFALLPALAVGLFSLSRATSALEAEAESTQLRNLSAVRAGLRDTFSAPQRLQEFLGEVFTDESLNDEAVERLSRKLQESAGTSSVSLYDDQGNLVSTVKPQGAPSESITSIPAAIRARILAEGAVFGEPELVGEVVQVPLFLPLKTPYGKTLFTMSRASFDEAQQQLGELLLFDQGENRSALPEDAVFVVDAEQRVIAHPNQAARLQSLRGQGALAALPSDSKAAAKNLRLASRYEINGVPYIGAVQRLDFAPFYVVTQLPESHIYEGAASLRSFVFLLLGITGLVSLGAALVLARGLTRPIRALVGFSKELAGRHFHRRLSLARNDELGLLGGALNHAAEDLERSEAQIRREQEIRSDLGRYLPRDLVDLVVRREQAMTLGGERRQITVLFADVVSFTPLAEKLKPEDSVAILNQLFTILTEIVFRHEGTVDKFLGDCVMAFFGAPKAQSDHAARALRAAEDMLKWLEIGNADWEKRYGVQIQLAIGVNTGEAIVGNIGSETRMEYTAIGDTVNVAARLEAIANPQQVVLTRATKEAAGDEFDLQALGHKTLSGRQGAVELFGMSL